MTISTYAQFDGIWKMELTRINPIILIFYDLWPEENMNLYR